MTSRTLALATVALAVPAAASAHIVLSETEATSGGYYVASFRVGHGCAAGQATTSLRVTLPTGVTGAKPRPMAGWAVQVEPTAVTWRGRLGDDAFDEFAILVRLPAATGPLYFPTVQTCGATSVAWTEIPAPVVTLRTPVGTASASSSSSASASHDHH